MKKRRLVRVKLKNDHFGFGLILDKTFMTFFDFISKEDNANLKTIINNPILFTNSVNYKIALKNNEWEVIGQLQVEDSLLEKKPYYVQDIIDKDLFFIVSPPNYDEMIKAKKEDCIGLELMSVSYSEHIEDRLNNRFFGTKLKWKSTLPFWLEEKGNVGNDPN